MKKYEILEHTADAKIKVFGKAKQDLFLNAMLGMMAVLKTKKEKGGQMAVRKIKIISPDINALLVDFLGEVNYLAQTHWEVYICAKFLKFSDTRLEAQVSGYKVNEFGGEIKAVTYHGLKILEVADHWEADIVFDI